MVLAFFVIMLVSLVYELLRKYKSYFEQTLFVKQHKAKAVVFERRYTLSSYSFIILDINMTLRVVS